MQRMIRSFVLLCCLFVGAAVCGCPSVVVKRDVQNSGHKHTWVAKTSPFSKTLHYCPPNGKHCHKATFVDAKTRKSGTTGWSGRPLE